MENYTRALLGLTDKNFIPEEHWLEVRLFDKSLIVVLGRQQPRKCESLAHTIIESLFLFILKNIRLR